MSASTCEHPANRHWSAAHLHPQAHTHAPLALKPGLQQYASFKAMTGECELEGEALLPARSTAHPPASIAVIDSPQFGLKTQAYKMLAPIVRTSCWALCHTHV